LVDRVYKKEIPELRKALEKLREDFASLDSKTDWIRLRIEPLLKHSASLEQLLESKKFSQESARLTRGVALFHSDLVYLKKNVSELKKILQSEKRSAAKNNES
jgi:predicted  nucleic acid-binding Zn-ribbon protein